MTTKTNGGSRAGRRGSLADWQAVPQTNQLCRDVEDAARKIGYVLDSAKSAEIVAYVCGQAGLGKSHAIRTALAERGLTGCFRAVSSYRDLIKAFEDAHRLRQPLILEESDQVLWSEKQANILKEATDAAGPRRISFETRVPDEDGKLQKVTKTVHLTAPLIVTSNKDMRDLSSFDRTMRPHVAALASRSAPIFLGAASLNGNTPATSPSATACYTSRTRKPRCRWAFRTPRCAGSPPTCTGWRTGRLGPSSTFANIFPTTRIARTCGSGICGPCL